MSFNGALEHIPLVDVIQLLHMTAKTGILYLKSPKGESQLVFHEGYFVSANHLNNSVRIGMVLVDMEAITDEQLEQALVLQKNAGQDRKPLIAMMIEQGIIDKDTAYMGLESLIEMTIVEVLTWPSGTFTLDVSKEYVSDEYRYFPEKLHQEILLNAQGVLMDALRIYDEKMRDGTLSKLFFSSESSEETPLADNEASAPVITADLLGLEDLDTIEREIPAVFTGLVDHDPAKQHRHMVATALPEAPLDRQEQLVSYLCDISRKSSDASKPPVTAVILMTRDELLSHVITTYCRHENLFAFSTDDEATLDMIIEQSLGRELHPVLVFDVTDDDDKDQALGLVLRRLTSYPRITVMIAACPGMWNSNGMRALEAGVRAIMPRPCRQCHGERYVALTIDFMSSLGRFLKTVMPPCQPEIEQRFSNGMARLRNLSEPPEIALALLNFAALQFERVITFVVAKSELIAEKSIGVTGSKSDGPAPPLMFRIALESRSLFQEAVEKGRPYFGQRNDNILTSVLYKEIGAPRSPKVMILPLISRGKVIALTYADFGTKPVSPPHTGLLEAMAQHAGLVLDNALYRKSIEKPA
ncbi:MAG: hypothetical protein A2X85_05305 [Geobacteraceae bacterium GWF2_54_21]|nr:MAG: hypothetical protein A2X85_05305 [Geobacteraceae bacterium GWF2_54_21]